MSEKIYQVGKHEYPESDLAILVWINPEIKKNPQRRLLETVTSKESNLPMIFPIKFLQSSIPGAVLVTNKNLQIKILSSTEQNPLIISLPLARKHLGWTEFDVPPRYKEPQ